MPSSVHTQGRRDQCITALSLHWPQSPCRPCVPRSTSSQSELALLIRTVPPFLRGNGVNSGWTCPDNWVKMAWTLEENHSHYINSWNQKEAWSWGAVMLTTRVPLGIITLHVTPGSNYSQMCQTDLVVTSPQGQPTTFNYVPSCTHMLFLYWQANSTPPSLWIWAALGLLNGIWQKWHCASSSFFWKEDINVYINVNNFFHRKIQNDIYVYNILWEIRKICKIRQI